MKYEVTYMLKNGTKLVYGKIEKNEKGQYLATYGIPHKSAFKTLAAAIDSFKMIELVQLDAIVGFSVSVID